MSTPSPWLPVLSNIAPAPIRRMSASFKAMDKIRQHQNLPVFDDVIAHPEVRLTSRSPIWSTEPPTDWSVYEAWKEDWFKKEVSNQFLITDPAICLPGFDLKRKDWTLLNRFCTGHGRCAATLHDWGIRDNPLCACGSKQTMLHIVIECPLTKFPGGLQALHSADEDSCSWLRKLSIR